jgi:hypothetical protein
MFEERGLAGPRTADQVEDDGADVVEVVPIDPGQGVVGGKEAGMDVDGPAWCRVVRMNRSLAVMAVAIRMIPRRGASA